MIGKRLAMSLLAIGAVSLMVTAGTLALFSDKTDNVNNTFTAGTVDIGTPTPFTCTVHAGGLAPGDSGQCAVSVVYQGSLDAWVGVDYSASGVLFGGAHPVELLGAFDATDTLLPVVAGKYVIGTFATGNTAATKIKYQWSIDAGNEYQNQSGTIALKFYAVQRRHNPEGAATGPVAWE